MTPDAEESVNPTEVVEVTEADSGVKEMPVLIAVVVILIGMGILIVKKKKA